MKELTEALKGRKRDSFKHCDDCAKEEKKEEGKGPESEEQLEFVMICLKCLHVGCTRKKNCHAEEHFKKNPDHLVVRGIVGRLFCYECDQDIEADEETTAKIKEIQKLFDLAISVPSTELIPTYISSNFCAQESIASTEEEEEEKATIIPMLKHKSSIAMEIEARSEYHASQLLTLSKQIATVKGLQNLGSTRRHWNEPNNRVLQCYASMLGCDSSFCLLLSERNAGSTKSVRRHKREYNELLSG